MPEQDFSHQELQVLLCTASTVHESLFPRRSPIPDLSGPTEMQCINVEQEEWAKWVILQDDTEEVGLVSVAELLTDAHEGLEPGEIDDRLVVSSIASQK